MQTTSNETTRDNFDFHQLTMTRGILLQHLSASHVAPVQLLQMLNSQSTITHWEELLGAAFDPERGRLMALVGVHRPRGYSGLFRRHGSIEYVRFFIDWEDGLGYRPAGMTHFRICDRPEEAQAISQPRYWRVSTPFERERYWSRILKGVQPKLKAVLSWHWVPDLDHGFVPQFGNTVETTSVVENGYGWMNMDESFQADSVVEELPIIIPDQAYALYEAAAR